MAASRAEPGVTGRDRPAPPGRDRRGLPMPLLFHLGAAATILGEGVAMAPLSASGRVPWPEPFAAEGAALGPLDLVEVAVEAGRRLSELLAGIEAWQRHPHRRALPDPPVLWRSGASRLLDFGGAGPAVVLIPSLINRAYILDLGKTTSLARHLAGQGLRSFLLDWGVAGEAERGFGLEAYINERLLPALDTAAAEAGPPALLGYCMGGGLAVAAAQLRPDLVRRLALIGTPWSFAEGQGIAHALRELHRRAGPDRAAGMLAALDSCLGAVPAELFQTLFALLDPGLALAKFRRFLRHDPASREAREFVELEDWLNDPAPLPGPAAIELLVDWQLRDLAGRLRWRVQGEAINPATLRLPVLAVCSTSDRIAPPSATRPLAEAIPGARILQTGTGHVGMIVGRAARITIRPALTEFLAAR